MLEQCCFLMPLGMRALRRILLFPGRAYVGAALAANGPDERLRGQDRSYNRFMLMPGASMEAPGNASRRLDQHATTHFHVQSMAEPAAVVPIHPGLVGGEGNRRGLLRADLHAHTMVDHDEAVGYVLDLVNVGDDHGDFVALLDGELVDTEGRCHRHHVHPDLVAV